MFLDWIDKRIWRPPAIHQMTPADLLHWVHPVPCELVFQASSFPPISQSMTGPFLQASSGFGHVDTVIWQSSVCNVLGAGTCFSSSPQQQLPLFQGEQCCIIHDLLLHLQLIFKLTVGCLGMHKTSFGCLHEGHNLTCKLSAQYESDRRDDDTRKIRYFQGFKRGNFISKTTHY